MIPRITIRLLVSNLLAISVLAYSSPSEPSITAAPSQTEAIPSQVTPSALTIHPTPSSLTTTLHVWDGILSSAEYMLEELNDHLHIDLRKRQGGVAATNAPQATTIATQMPSVTTYGADRGWPVEVYTQLFSAVPDQWPSPEPGTIGLGTIQGQIGVVKTRAKRTAVPLPTGQVIRIKGREIVVP